jgi:hypothetical protein
LDGADDNVGAIVGGALIVGANDGVSEGLGEGAGDSVGTRVVGPERESSRACES